MRETNAKEILILWVVNAVVSPALAILNVPDSEYRYMTVVSEPKWVIKDLKAVDAIWTPNPMYVLRIE